MHVEFSAPLVTPCPPRPPLRPSPLPRGYGRTSNPFPYPLSFFLRCLTMMLPKLGIFVTTISDNLPYSVSLLGYPPQRGRHEWKSPSFPRLPHSILTNLKMPFGGTAIHAHARARAHAVIINSTIKPCLCNCLGGVQGQAQGILTGWGKLCLTFS